MITVLQLIQKIARAKGGDEEEDGMVVVSSPERILKRVAMPASLKPAFGKHARVYLGGNSEEGYVVEISRRWKRLTCVYHFDTDWPHAQNCSVTVTAYAISLMPWRKTVRLLALQVPGYSKSSPDIATQAEMKDLSDILDNLLDKYGAAL